MSLDPYPLNRILISNDDGIDAIGIRILKEIALRLTNEVWVIAPTGNRSGMSRAITLHKDIIIEQRGEKEFACSGTPSDCVIVGMAEVMDVKPDLILSGINAGMNGADDVFYSGTIAAAMEGVLMGVSAIALSQHLGRTDPAEFEAAAAHGERVIRDILKAGIPPRTVMNVNFPAVSPDEVRGVLPATPDKPQLGDRVSRGDSPNSYCLGPLKALDQKLPGSDRAVMEEGWISLTALGMDLTSPDIQATLKTVEFY